MKNRSQANAGWNFAANLWDIGFITFGMGLVSQATIMPLLVSELTDSKIAIGLIPAIYSLGFLLPQLLTANFTERLRVNKPFVMLLGGVGERGPYLLIGLAVLGLCPDRAAADAGAALPAAGGDSTSAGMANPAWYSMIAKVIPVQRRGLWSGLARSLGALLGIAGGWPRAGCWPTGPFRRTMAISFCWRLPWSRSRGWAWPPTASRPARPSSRAPAWATTCGACRRCCAATPTMCAFWSASVANLGAMAGGF